MFKVKGVDHIVLRTDCLQKMLGFYRDLLGCQVVKEQPDFHLTQLDAGRSMIDLVEVVHRPLDHEHNVEHFCLQIDPFDYDSLKALFDEQGIEIYRYGERNGAQGLGYSFYLKDPQGNELELKAYVNE